MGLFFLTRTVTVSRFTSKIGKQEKNLLMKVKKTKINLLTC